MPFKSIIRLGSITDEPDTVSHGGRRVECNTIQGVKNSANKLLMKQCFSDAMVKTAEWYTSNGNETFFRNNANIDGKINIKDLSYPIISKSLYGSRGQGNVLHRTQEELKDWMQGKDLKGYIFEKFYTYNREYRIHVTQGGCFYTCRKLLKNDAPKDTWQRHDDVCTWILEENPSFKKPKNWNEIIKDCVNAQKALGLDICCFDVMIQGSKDGKERTNPDWIICESASAPSFGDITAKKYIQEIPKILKEKFVNR